MKIVCDRHWAQIFDSAKRDSTQHGPQMPDTASGKIAFDMYITWHGERNNMKLTLQSILT